MPDKYCLSYNGLQLRIGIGHENSIWLTIDGYYIQEPPHLLLRELYNRIKNDAMQNPIAEDGIIKLLTKQGFDMIIGDWHELIYENGVPQIKEYIKRFNGLSEFGDFLRRGDKSKVIEYLKLEQYLDPHYLGIIL